MLHDVFFNHGLPPFARTAIVARGAATPHKKMPPMFRRLNRGEPMVTAKN
jgi:hypothetical protein